MLAKCIITVLETGRQLPTYPTVFTKPSPAVADHREDIPIPLIAQSQCDYEGECLQSWHPEAHL